MKKLIDTLISNFSTYFSEMFLLPFITALAAMLIFAIIVIIKKNKNLKNCSCILCVFSLAFFAISILQITLLSRIGTYVQEPFIRLWGNWTVITEWKYKYELTCILNILLFIPFTFSLRWFYKCIINGRKSATVQIIACTVLSLLLSLAIESSQAIFHIGTFQISDLFYNTLGGLIGAIIYNIVIGIKYRGSSK